jgi:hypothetical protein
MLHLILEALIFGGIGFGIGRVKNAKKLEAVSSELSLVETTASADVTKLVSAIRSKL